MGISLVLAVSDWDETPIRASVNTIPYTQMHNMQRLWGEASSALSHSPCFGDLSPSIGIDAVIWRRVSPMSWITLSNIYDVFCCFIRCLTFWYSSAHDCCKLVLSPVCVTGHFFCSHLLLDLGHHRSPEISEETVRRCVMQRATVCWLCTVLSFNT